MAVQSFFRGKFLLKAHNHTHIALIPKAESAATVHNYRPISLCNVFYKIIWKKIGKYAEKFSSLLISPLQTAFVSDKDISKNSILAHEIMHFLKIYIGKENYMAIKIDMGKACDRVEWSFFAGNYEMSRFP